MVIRRGYRDKKIAQKLLWLKNVNYFAEVRKFGNLLSVINVAIMLIGNKKISAIEKEYSWLNCSFRRIILKRLKTVLWVLVV